MTSFDIKQYVHVAGDTYIKPDEAFLLLAIADSNFTATELSRFLQQSEFPAKRIAYILNKWTSRGWFEYGVSPECGWLLPRGREAARQLKQHGDI